MKLYQIYSKDGLPVTQFKNSALAAKFVGLTLGSFYCAVTRGSTTRSGYSVAKVEI